MRAVIAGGSGFLGQSLSAALVSCGHHVQILTRHTVTPDTNSPPSPVQHITWNPDGQIGDWTPACQGADIVINLAGASIGTHRWSLPRKAELIASRIRPTRSLVRFIEQATPAPTVFISASAIGYYGDRPGEYLTESSSGAKDFLAELTYEWEQHARLSLGHPTRLVALRTGIVLDPREGALAKMLPPFRLFTGGPFGSGRQYMSWIHRDDWVSLVQWVIDAPDVNGPVNATAPHPVTNAEFARTLGRVLHRPAIMPVPAFVLKMMLGEMAGPLLLHSQRVLPARATAGGFRFAFDTIEPALENLLR
ncbi:MAG: TIGR01777 family oxidoreductase [Acidobacteria bacterium]|nr:TIGR01777 family oxidoreductase [Acidobacteriota bacterium]